MSELSVQDLKHFEQHLNQRREELRWIIHDVLLDSQREDYLALAGQVHDTAEESVAELLADMNLATLEREVEELQDIEAALARIQEGSYGKCMDCAEAIDVERLKAYPTAKRCVTCQRRYEDAKRGGKDATPSL